MYDDMKQKLQNGTPLTPDEIGYVFHNSEEVDSYFNDNIKHKLQNGLELTSNEVEYLFVNGYATEFTISPSYRKYNLIIFDDENYIYTIYVTQNTRTGDFNFPPQVAMKGKHNV